MKKTATLIVAVILSMSSSVLAFDGGRSMHVALTETSIIIPLTGQVAASGRELSSPCQNFSKAPDVVTKKLAGFIPSIINQNRILLAVAK